MMSTRRLMPFTIVMLLVLQTTALNFVTPAEAASGRGGTNDDFTVKSITIGNASVAADQWVQSDGSVVDYIFVDQTIEVTVAVHATVNRVSVKMHPSNLTSFTQSDSLWKHSISTPRF